MAIRLKVARTAKELDDVFWLRHEVYVVEDKRFGGRPLANQRITDHFDALPMVANIVAYDQEEPVGTLRLNLDTGCGLPSEDVYDFAAYRQELQKCYGTDHLSLGSAGMLAIREKWRCRRDVIKAMFKLATGIGHSWGATHGIATVNHDTVSIYERLGFKALNEPQWNEVIGNYIVPMAGEFEAAYLWAFGNLLNAKLDRFWLEAFSAHFERLLIAQGEQLFTEGDEAEHAYIIDNGWIQISRKDPEGHELTLATLSHGALFGELALIDESPRSATAIAGTHAELIQLNRQDFLESIKENPQQVERLLRVFAERIRRTDQLAMVMAYAPQTGRVKYALDQLRISAVPDLKDEDVLVARVGPAALAKVAGVREHEVRFVLELEKQAGRLDYGGNSIRFLNYMELPNS